MVNRPDPHRCQPPRLRRLDSEGAVWTCGHCGSGWHVRANGRWGRDGQELRIEVPRLDRRSSLERCRATAQIAARQQGFIGPPDEVASYEGAPGASSVLGNPQGYVFTWYEPNSQGDAPAFP
jgi:hypothetical protein